MMLAETQAQHAPFTYLLDVSYANEGQALQRHD